MKVMMSLAIVTRELNGRLGEIMLHHHFTKAAVAGGGGAYSISEEEESCLTQGQEPSLNFRTKSLWGYLYDNIIPFARVDI